jgi:large subunit ribosomal protein L37Ae
MSAALLERPETPNQPPTGPQPGTVLGSDLTAAAVSCPVCGSGSTYQTMDGRWGCTQCGSSWG